MRQIESLDAFTISSKGGSGRNSGLFSLRKKIRKTCGHFLRCEVWRVVWTFLTALLSFLKIGCKSIKVSFNSTSLPHLALISKSESAGRNVFWRRLFQAASSRQEKNKSLPAFHLSWTICSGLMMAFVRGQRFFTSQSLVACLVNIDVFLDPQVLPMLCIGTMSFGFIYLVITGKFLFCWGSYVPENSNFVIPEEKNKRLMVSWIQPDRWSD